MIILLIGLVFALPAPGALAAESLPAPHLPEITGNPAVDEAIRHRAEERGYRPRLDEPTTLVAVDGQLLTPEAARAWERLQEAAVAAGHHLRLISGYRSPSAQRSLFLRRFRGSSPAGIDATLRWTAPPGYSKHHTGEALDITVRGVRAGAFGSSRAHAWLSADACRNARIHGFAPSYPAGGPPQGPEPEPWEWVYVGPPQPPSIVADLKPA